MTLDFSRRGRALVGQEMFLVLERAKKIEETGAHVYHLELGNPRQAPPRELLDKAVDALSHRHVGYTYSAGLPVLRQGVASYFQAATGRALTEANVAISPANLLITQFLELTCDPGDRVVLFSPAFPTYWAAADYVGLETIDVGLDAAHDFELTGDAIDTALAARPRAIIVNSANNPTGAVYRREPLERLARECERQGIWLMSDETYAEVSFARPFFSLAGLDLRHVLVIGSFSKMFSVPGFRTGFAVGDAEVIGKVSLSTSTLISCLPIFTQMGCAAGLRRLDRYTAGVRSRCAHATALCDEELSRSAVLRHVVPHAGFYFLVDIGATGLDDMEFAHRLLDEHHTAVTPGRSFGRAWDRHVRIATCGRLDDVLEGTRRLVAFAESLATDA